MKKISIIVPSFRDGKNVRRLVRQIGRKKLNDIEIIIVESGSPNYRKFLSKKVIFLNSRKGRALQMNFGARRAKGKLLVFLHADSDVSDINFPALNENFNRKSFGCFRIRFKSDKKYFRIIEFTSNLRKKIFGIPFGDQGLVVSKELFDKVGGFSEEGFEDIDMALQLMRYSKLRIINQSLKTSPRRFLKHGIIRTHITMGLIFLSYSLGLKKRAYWLYKLIK